MIAGKLEIAPARIDELVPTFPDVSADPLDWIGRLLRRPVDKFLMGSVRNPNGPPAILPRPWDGPISGRQTGGGVGDTKILTPT
ncbi:MAG: hypothetical protein ACREDR_32290, partial [Blastocatellia bacterium]